MIYDHNSAANGREAYARELEKGVVVDPTSGETVQTNGQARRNDLFFITTTITGGGGGS